MSYFIRNGNRYTIADEHSIEVNQRLPAGNYIIKIDAFGNHYLEIVDNFVNPPKLYGNTIKMTQRIINTYLERGDSTGAILAGEKGSGKTLLARNLGIECAKINVPCVIVNTPFHGDVFNKFIQDIDQSCMILFDEFEKVYSPEDQMHILTLMDGVFTNKKLFIITCNDKYRVDIHMRNRPGRIFYHLDFKGLEEAFIREYCSENLQNLTHMNSICNISGLFMAFNFDMLKALVEEMNRYGESPQEALEYLNIKPDYSTKTLFTVSLDLDSSSIPPEYVYTESGSDAEWEGNPLNQNVYIEYKLSPIKKDGESGSLDCDYGAAVFKIDDMKSFSGNKIVYVNDKGDSLVLKKKERKEHNFYKFADF
jgi:hypothetical protein